MYNSVTSKDGTTISYYTQGSGEGLLIVHGTFRASEHYKKIADELSKHFTVYVMDRRGRNESGEYGNNYTMHVASEDIIAILEKHDIKYLFGHSFGAVASLYTANLYSLNKLVLFEPPLTKYMNLSWIPKFEAMLNKNDIRGAMPIFIKGMEMGGPMKFVPNPILKLLFKPFEKEPDWDKNTKLLKTIPTDFNSVNNLPENYFDEFKNLKTPTLILGGTKSPNYLIKALHDLDNILENSKLTILEGLNHNAPDEAAPEMVAPEIIKFLQ